MPLPSAASLHFNIDQYLSPTIPRNRVDRLPRPIAHFLGYRDKPGKPLGNIIIAAWSFFGGFVGTAALGGFFMSDFIQSRGGPIIIASYGAAAILEYNAIESPFSQPRNQILGQLIAALIGICITKLFALNTAFESLRWLAGALSVGISSAAMALTGTIHPPAGATALLAAVEPSISGLGWLYLALVLISSFITLGWSLIVNNLQRRYPVYWWTPPEVVERVKEEEGGKEKGGDAERAVHGRDGAGTEAEMTREGRLRTYGGKEIVISAQHGVLIPDTLNISSEERGVLDILAQRLRDESSTMGEEHSDSGSSRNELGKEWSRDTFVG